MAGYSQNDPRWAGDFLGTSNVWRMGTVNGDTAHAAGCFVTAGANVLRAFGHDITPGDLNRLATARGLINSNGDITRADWLEVLFPDVLHFVERKNWGSALADLHYLDIRNDLNTEIIIEIDDSPAGGMQTHFMRTVGWDGGTDVIVDDSWDAIRKGVNAYGRRWNPALTAAYLIYTADKYVRVIPPAPQPAPAPVIAPQPDPVPTPAPAPAPQPTPSPVQPPVVTPPAPDPTPAPVIPVPQSPAIPAVVVGPAKTINTSWQSKLVWWLWKLIKTIAVSIKTGK